jgi:hypothetical protein
VVRVTRDQATLSEARAITSFVRASRILGLLGLGTLALTLLPTPARAQQGGGLPNGAPKACSTQGDTYVGPRSTDPNSESKDDRDAYIAIGVFGAVFVAGLFLPEGDENID